MTNLMDLTLPGLEELLAGMGEQRYRATQLFQWLWAKGVLDPAAMSNLPAGLRQALATQAQARLPQVAEERSSKDGTIKLLLRLADNALVETVLIPEEDHWTQCLSTQAGCPMACAFCSTGRLGFERNLTSGEMAGQALLARLLPALAHDARPLRNLVFMGMGEPLLNLRELLKALEVLTHPQGMDFSARRVTVSTVGLVEGLRELGESGLASLAVSLHAPTQELRERLMPKAARQVPLDRLMAALKEYPLKPRQRLTFEYLLLGGVNDSVAHARELVRLLSHVKAKVNLIAFNEGPGVPFRAPDPAQVEAFRQALMDKNLFASLRKSRGADIAAACGQLRAEADRTP